MSLSSYVRVQKVLECLALARGQVHSPVRFNPVQQLEHVVELLQGELLQHRVRLLLLNPEEIPRSAIAPVEVEVRSDK